MACVLPAYDMGDQRRFGPQHYLPSTALPRPFYFTAQHGQRRYDTAPAVPPSVPAAAGPRQGPPQKRKRHGKRYGNAAKRRRGGLQARAETPSTIPATTPRAPYNTSSYLLQRDGETPPAGRGASDGYPQSGYTAGYHNLNDEAAELGAKLDFFGTGMPAGLLAEYHSRSEADSEDEEDEDDWPAAGGLRHGDRRSGGDLTDAEQEAALRSLPAAVRAKLREQGDRLARLEEENLDLKEKLSLAQLELQDFRVKYGGPGLQAQTAVSTVTDASDPPAAGYADVS